ncbi:transcription factor Maf isoform X2 [Drosophila willistoni]|uniref:transcription factor Maf isoform X2 n=1 Tax=Drosophila willistoni TaxID=7260 RepID=UPI000C26CA04|nr:transcription factor Maf isoform X2 [Drosophila willistoni]
MRRQQTRYRSDSIASPLTGARKPSLTASPSLSASAAMGSGSPSSRRESLVKPTWQHITPGQLPPKTLDKINGITSDDSDDDDMYPKRRPSVIVHQRQQSISQQPLLLEYMTTAYYRGGVGGGVGGATGGVVPGGGDHYNQQQPSSSSAPAFGNNSFLARLSGVRLTGNGHATSTAIGGSGGAEQPLLDTASGSYGGGGGGCGQAGGGGGGAGAGANAVRSVVAPGPGSEGAGATLCKSAGRALIRMISSNNNQEDDEDFDIMGKNKVVVVDGTRVKLQIWDTAGQERFRSVTHAYYRDAHALLLLYDVTNKTTYDNIRAWLGEIREYAQEDVVIVLIGNKADCSSSERQVKREDGERLGREHNVPFMETSAKTGLNVELAFTAVARQLKSRGYEHGDDGKFNVHDFVRDNTNTKARCSQCM